MHYSDGQEVRLGDTVKQRNNDIGVVVCSIDTNEYSAQYPEAEWSYLNEGAMIVFAKDGLIHCSDGEDLSLVAREQSS